MHERARALIDRLGLRPHPEGGYYGEVFRSDLTVQPADGREPRRAITAIYFLLPAGEHSAWHRVASDEVWMHIEGDALNLWCCDLAPESNAGASIPSGVRTLTVGRLDQNASPIQIVRAGTWQSAEPLGEYTLVGCTVGPGFEFVDFTLARDEPSAVRSLVDAGCPERLL